MALPALNWDKNNLFAMDFLPLIHKKRTGDWNFHTENSNHLSFIYFSIRLQLFSNFLNQLLGNIPTKTWIGNGFSIYAPIDRLSSFFNIAFNH